jgi:hypothetical protein
VTTDPPPFNLYLDPNNRDPYRDPEPVTQLTAMTHSALVELQKRLPHLPPSKVENLARCLAAFHDPLPTNAFEVLQALADLAGRDVPAPDLLYSGLIEHDGITHLPPRPGCLFIPRAMRVVVTVANDYVAILREAERKNAPPEIQLTVNDYIVLERCTVSEFEKMTPINCPVISSGVPLKIEIFRGPQGATGQLVEVILRGDRRDEPSFYIRGPGGSPTRVGYCGGGPSWRP